MATCKFKVGDKVIGNHPTRYGITNTGWVGEVTKVGKDRITVYGRGIGCSMHFSVEPQYFDLYKPEDKIVITHNGKTTTTTLRRADGSAETATARCAPEDTFDFNIGAKLAMERLMEKVNPVGEAPKYWTGRAVCIKNAPGDTDFIVGKIYRVEDGKFIDENGKNRPVVDNRVTKPSDLTAKVGYWSGWFVKFIPIVEDDDKPLTVEELKKMDGQKVWLVSLDKNKKPERDNEHGGWHTVDVKNDRVVDSDGAYYRLNDVDTDFGFLAYRQKPTK